MPAILNALRYFPFVIMLVMAIMCCVFWEDISVKNILGQVSENKPLVLAMVIAIYALKSISVVFPLSILYLSVGSLFSFVEALTINSCGLIVCLTIPYFVGRFSGEGFVSKIIAKYPKAKKIDNFKNTNQWVFSFLLKFVGIFPGDITSMLLGSMRVPYGVFLSGSLVGMFPSLITITSLGETITTPHTPGFLISLAAICLNAVISLFVYRRYQKKEPEK